MELFLLAVICYGLGLLTLLFPKSGQVMAHYVSNGLALVASTLVTYVTGNYFLLQIPVEELHWGSYSLVFDSWSGIFLLLTGLAGMITSFYALGYGRGYEGNRLRHLGSTWNLFLMSMVLVLLAGDAFSFLVFWEIMAVASFLLVNHDCHIHETWTAAYQYLVMTSVGTTALMIAFFLVGAHSPSFNFLDMAKNTLPANLKHVAFAAAFIGFGLKAGLVPLHIWLPKAHPAAPSHVSALMSGVMLKIALYGFGRFMFGFLPEWNYWWAVVVMVIGALSAFWGVLLAQMEKDIKKVLAYSSVENMGVIFTAFGCGMLLKVVVPGYWYLLAMGAALVHAFNHSVMKVLMFMSAGSIMHGTGSKNLELFGGLAGKMPYTAACTLVGSLALAAIPLTCGFNGEWLLLQSLMTLGRLGNTQDIRLWTALVLILMGFTGALALGCFVRYYGIAFLGRARSELVEHAHESDGFMVGAMSVSSCLVLLLGLYPLPLLKLVAQALGLSDNQFVSNNMGIAWSQGISYQPLLLLAVVVVLGGILYLVTAGCYETREVTWNCGTDPTARQQYSAIGFSKPVRRAFDYLLQPKRIVTIENKEHSYFGGQKRVQLEVPDLITEKMYAPLQKSFIRCSAYLRRLQQGSVRLYVGYVMAALVVVLVWGAVYK